MMILVVVDMQPDFPASQKQTTLNEIEKLICHFVSINELIIFLEYNNHGTTHQRLLDKVGGYNRFVSLTKKWDCGGNEIFLYCNQNFISADHFVICGVNIGACVHKTAARLAELKPVTVIQRACNGEAKPNWTRFDKPNITLERRYETFIKNYPLQYASSCGRMS